MYTTQYYNNGLETGIGLFILGFFFVAFVLGIIAYVIQGLSLHKVAKLEGREDGWFAWVPVLNTVLMISLGGGNPLVLLGLLACFIPFIGWLVVLAVDIYILVMYYRLLKKYEVEPALFWIGIFFTPVMIYSYWALKKKAEAKLM